MAIRVVSPQSYQIERQGVEGVVFSASSPHYLVWPAAVAFARERGSVLQSAREAAAFRVEANGQDSANLYQVTRTVVAYVQVDGRWYGAVDDIADPERNLILARADEGYRAHNTQKKWILPKTDVYVRDMLDRATRDNRIFAVSEQSSLELATKQESGVSSFGAHAGIQAIFGNNDLPKAYAAFLQQNKYRTGQFWSLTPQILSKLGIGNDDAEIRVVGLGNAGTGCLDFVDANCGCSNFGRARGVGYSEPVKPDA